MNYLLLDNGVKYQLWVSLFFPIADKVCQVSAQLFFTFNCILLQGVPNINFVGLDGQIWQEE